MISDEEYERYWLNNIGSLENVITKEKYALLSCSPYRFAENLFKVKFPFVTNPCSNIISTKKDLFRLVTSPRILFKVPTDCFCRIKEIRLSQSKSYRARRITSLVVEELEQFEVFKYMSKYNKKYGKKTGIGSNNQAS
ncbi:MAG: hypothetical protein ACREBJ_03780 [Nitrosotalea sp.]